MKRKKKRERRRKQQSCLVLQRFQSVLERKMEDFRSKSCGDGRMQIERSYGGMNSMQDLRCYSASYTYSVHPTETQARPNNNNDVKLKKGKSTNGCSSSRSWSFTDPELQRKKRVASYKAYTLEGKVKGSLKKSFRWLKGRCTKLIYGY